MSSRAGKVSLVAASLLFAIAAATLASTSFAALVPGGKSLRAVVYSPPETEITSRPPAWSSDKTPEYEFAANQKAATFECRWFERSWFDCPSPFVSGKKDDGRYEFSVRAVNAGRVDPTPEKDVFVIDTAPPKTFVKGPDATFDLTPRFDLASNEENVSFECSLDGANWSVCEDPWTKALSYGQHVLRARATDRAGNTDLSPARHEFRIKRDTTPPATTIEGPEKSKDRTPAFRIASNEKDSTFECSLDGGAWTACSRNYSPPAALSYGTHRLRARATDTSGNTDPSPATKQFRITR